MGALFALPLATLAYYTVAINGTGDHLIIYRWVDALWRGDFGLYLIDEESPRFLFQYLIGLIGYAISFGSPFGTVYIISLTEIILFVAALAAFQFNLKPDKHSVVTFYWIAIITYSSLHLLGWLTPSWTSLQAIVHPMRHTSAMSTSLAAFALLFFLIRKNMSLLDLKFSTQIVLFLIGLFAVVSDKLFAIWCLAPFGCLLAGYRFLHFINNPSPKTAQKSIIEIAFLFGVCLIILFVSEWMRSTVIAMGGGFGLVGVTSTYVIKNLQSADVLLPRAWNTLTGKESIYFIAVAMIIAQSLLEQFSQLRWLSQNVIVKAVKQMNFVATKMLALLCLSLFFVLTGMVATKAINYRYVEFFNVLVFIASLIIVHGYVIILFRRFQSVVSFGKRVGVGALFISALAMSALTAHSMMENSRKMHRFQGISNWIESQFEEEEHVFGMAHYWPAHEISALSEKIDLLALDKDKVQTYPRWENIGKYFVPRTNCLSTRRIRFVLNEQRFGRYNPEQIRAVFGDEDRHICSDERCRYELFVYERGADIRDLLARGRDAGEPTMQHSVYEIFTAINPKNRPLCDGKD